ncbi:protein FAM200C-like [Acipenser ruthenus]|uniref:protein FAM200C-like n=1 Tax=Acipenser ruthenus TaxID=7906 RepID=UPI00145ABB69|nr:protein FAM200C-like [Acipenser ruthenus]
MAKRKKDDDYRSFQPEWTDQFAFVEKSGSAVCLICNERITSLKKSNVKRHFETHHAAFAAKYPDGDCRKKACAELQRRMQTGQQQLLAWTNKGGNLNSASFAGALEIVRSGKPFTDGEYIKGCVLSVAKELFNDLPNKDKIIQKIEDMPLSARTVHDRALVMARQIEEMQINDISSSSYFSLSLDESTDVSNVAQLSIVGRYVTGDTVREESLAVLPMKDTTRGEDVLKSLMDFATEKKLPLNKLISVCTDGAPSMLGKHKGFIALLCEQEKRPILNFHCIVHQEALCAQSCGEELREVMSLVVRIVNFIVARALNDRQFKALLDEVGSNYPGLLLHSNVRWLSRGKVLTRFAACLNEVRAFLEMKGNVHPELTDIEWLLKFHYLVDITCHLNHLNVKMQGIGNTILSLQQAVFAFETNLEVFIRDIESGRLLHFETLRVYREDCLARDPAHHFDLRQLAAFTSDLLMLFKSRFVDFRRHADLFKVTTHPHVCTVDAQNLSVIPGISIGDFELEAAELKVSDMWVSKFFTLNSELESLARQRAELAKQHKWADMRKLQHKDNLILKTWNELPATFSTLHRVSVAVLTMFGSTYTCEQSFSHLNNIKTNLRSRLTDESLNACMKLNLTSLRPQLQSTQQNDAATEISLM